MPYNTPCERCLRVGLVSMERIITGTTVTLSYHCGACAYVWQFVAPDLRQPVRVTLRLKKDRRKSA
jgi:hypothetical protein